MMSAAVAMVWLLVCVLALVCAATVVGFVLACRVAGRSEVDPTDPWRLAVRIHEQDAGPDVWQVLRALPPDRPAVTGYAPFTGVDRRAAMAHLVRVLAAEPVPRLALPVVPGRTSGGQHRAP